jgi:hypothetical protein
VVRTSLRRSLTHRCFSSPCFSFDLVVSTPHHIAATAVEAICLAVSCKSPAGSGPSVATHPVPPSCGSCAHQSLFSFGDLSPSLLLLSLSVSVCVSLSFSLSLFVIILSFVSLSHTRAGAATARSWRRSTPKRLPCWPKTTASASQRWTPRHTRSAQRSMVCTGTRRSRSS